MKNKNYLLIGLGALLGFTLTFLQSDIHFYLARGYITAGIALIVGFSCAFLFLPAKSKNS
jgi:hypothetical protein